MKRLVLFLIVLGVLVYQLPEPGPDAAVPGARWQAKAIGIAAGYWQSSCQVKVKWAAMPPRVLGQSVVGACLDDGRGTEKLAFALTREKWGVQCATVVHEEGHLLGLGHSHNPYNIMYPVITGRNIPNACRR